MHQRAQGHSGTGWRLPLTATVNFQHNQFMCSSIITICVLHKEDSPEEQKSAGGSSSPPATPGAEGRWKRRRRAREGGDRKEVTETMERRKVWSLNYNEKEGGSLMHVGTSKVSLLVAGSLLSWLTHRPRPTCDVKTWRGGRGRASLRRLLDRPGEPVTP